MKPLMQRVLNVFIENKRKGVTGDDFPKKTSYTKRISELRRIGYQIIDKFEPQTNGGRFKRYWLIGEPK